MNSNNHFKYEKLSLYRPENTLRAPGVWDSQNFQTIGTWRWQGFPSPTHWPPLIPGRYFIYKFIEILFCLLKFQHTMFCLNHVFIKIIIIIHTYILRKIKYINYNFVFMLLHHKKRRCWFLTPFLVYLKLYT
jgi:hypothetical protein